MPEIPEGPSKTVIAIDEALEAAQKLKHGYRLSPSTLGEKCDRKLWYSFRWATKPEVFTGQKLRIFETGKLYEIRLLEYLRTSGQEVVSHEGVDAEGKPKQIGVGFARGHAYGFLDAETFNVPEARKKWHVAELKSHKLKSYEYLVSHGVQKAKPEHYVQTQIYMDLRGRSRGQYVAVCKDDDRIHTERFDYDIELCTRVKIRAERIAFSDWAPPRISDKPHGWPCGWCRHVDLCHGEAMPETNCRTCLHIAARDDGVWHCTRHRFDLDRAAQEKGCSSHLFLPSLIPGEQFNSSVKGEWVEYRMRDGTIWRDGATT